MTKTETLKLIKDPEEDMLILFLDSDIFST